MGLGIAGNVNRKGNGDFLATGGYIYSRWAISNLVLIKSELHLLTLATFSYNVNVHVFYQI